MAAAGGDALGDCRGGVDCGGVAMAELVTVKAWNIAEQWLIDHKQRHGRIEISHSFMAEWDLVEMGQREKREWCEAWTLEGGEPRALMANLRGKK